MTWAPGLPDEYVSEAAPERKEEEEKRTKAIALLETVRQKPVRLRRSGTMR